MASSTSPPSQSQWFKKRSLDWVDNGASELTTHLRFKFNTNMVDHWSELGFVLNVGTTETPDFVEVQRTLENGENKSGSPSKPNPKVASHRP
ncbi:MAG: hypothetical protein F6K65_30855 [Moorea sp. SIO3C2]|nr:hypothetical protein [Moorena sp. SIO3C2]